MGRPIKNKEYPACVYISIHGNVCGRKSMAYELNQSDVSLCYNHDRVSMLIPRTKCNNPNCDLYTNYKYGLCKKHSGLIRTVTSHNNTKNKIKTIELTPSSQPTSDNPTSTESS